jgi:hypothetical protein
MLVCCYAQDSYETKIRVVLEYLSERFDVWDADATGTVTSDSFWAYVQSLQLTK